MFHDKRDWYYWRVCKRAWADSRDAVRDARWDIFIVAAMIVVTILAVAAGGTADWTSLWLAACGIGLVVVTVFIVALVRAPVLLDREGKEQRAADQGEMARITNEAGQAITDLVRTHKREIERLSDRLTPSALNEDNFRWQVAKWRCRRNGVEYQFLGIDCLNESSSELLNIAIVAKGLATYVDGTWVGLDQIARFNETTLGVCKDDFISNEPRANIPLAGQRRWAIMMQTEHGSGASLCAADPNSRNTLITHSLYRIRLEVSSLALMGQGIELYVELTTEGMNFEMNGRPQYIVAQILKFVDRSDKRILEAKESVRVFEQ